MAAVFLIQRAGQPVPEFIAQLPDARASDLVTLIQDQALLAGGSIEPPEPEADPRARQVMVWEIDEEEFGPHRASCPEVVQGRTFASIGAAAQALKMHPQSLRNAFSQVRQHGVTGRVQGSIKVKGCVLRFVKDIRD